MKFVQLTIDGTEVVKFQTEKVAWWYNLLVKRHLPLILFSKFNCSDFGPFGHFLGNLKKNLRILFFLSFKEHRSKGVNQTNLLTGISTQCSFHVYHHHQSNGKCWAG